jgi:hypothetical protein
VPGDDRLYRRLEVQRNAEILREMVQRSERQDAESCPGPGQGRCHGADRAVTSAGDDQGRALLQRAARRLANLTAGDQGDSGLDAVSSEGSHDSAGDVVEIAGS